MMSLNSETKEGICSAHMNVFIYMHASVCPQHYVCLGVVLNCMSEATFVPTIGCTSAN